MIYETSDYGIFTIRDDNRDTRFYADGIDPDHVKKIADSVRLNNMLSINPILVNESLEVIDGQHRLRAAQECGVSIFYIIDPNITANDMLQLNINRRNWDSHDKLNFYRKNGKESYQKLYEFIQKYKISLRLGLLLTDANRGAGRQGFDNGTFQFNMELTALNFETCIRTLNKLRAIIPVNKHLETARFWQPLLKLVTHPEFNSEHWLSKIEMHPEKFSIKATQKQYFDSFKYVYNYKTQRNKIKFKD